MLVSVKNSTMVQPASDTPTCSLWISNLDLLAPRLHIFVVHIYRFDCSSNFFDPEVLKDALSKALVVFYPVAGRLKRTKDGRIVINCSGAGALFVEATTESVLNDWGDFTPSMQLQKLAPDVDYSLHISSCPILLAQVTFFQCGGVSMVIGIHHTVVDGISAMHFTNYWSDLARGLNDLAVPPFVDRHLLQARIPPTPSFPHVEYQDPPALMTNSSTSSTPHPTSTPTTISNLRISREQLNLLKSKCKLDDLSKNYSSFEIIAGHVWRCLCMARSLAPDQRTKFYILVDGRGRLRPQLSLGYLGNATFMASPVESAGELVSRPLAFAAAAVRDALAGMTDEYLRSGLDCLELKPDLTPLVRGACMYQCPNLVVSSWARLPLHGVDFGWGKPIYVGPVKIWFEGLAYVLPSAADDGGLDLVLSLQEQHIESFCNYLYCI